MYEFVKNRCLLLLLQGGTTPINLYVEDTFHRAARGGAGGVKSITNYAPVKFVFRVFDECSQRTLTNIVFMLCRC